MDPPFVPPCLWQGKGGEHFLPDPWYDSLEGELYDGLKREPKRSGRLRSTILEPRGQEDKFHCRMRWACKERR
jgi:hypothetical protein